MFVKAVIGCSLLVFFSLLDMLLNCLLGSSIFLWFLIIQFIFFSCFGVFCFFIGLCGHSLFEWFHFFWVGFVFFLARTRLSVYMVMVVGWSSDSGCCLLGGFRTLTQTISYAVWLAFILLSFVVLVSRYDLSYFCIFQVYLWLIFLSHPLSFVG
jgi:NADH:ubiquinone oxidoreductase subunit H